MAMPVTQLEASVDVSKTDAGWLVTTTITDRSGTEVHKRVSDPRVEEESAYYDTGGQMAALTRLGIPTGFTAAAIELRLWWETDRFTLVYRTYFAKQEDHFPNLEWAFQAVRGMTEHESGVPEEIREFGSGRVLYRNQSKSDHWERVADDFPPVEEFEGVERLWT